MLHSNPPMNVIQAFVYDQNGAPGLRLSDGIPLPAQPNLADYPLYPKRVNSFATIVVSCLLLYGIAWLLVAGVREHASA